MTVTKKKTIPFKFGDKHKEYIKCCASNTYNIAEGAVRAGKTVDNVFAFAHEIKTSKDKIHLATGSTSANAKLNIGDANGFGLEYIFRGQCHWGKFKGNECLYIKGISTKHKQKIVIFAGGAKADSYKKIRGNSYGMWIATEINLHHDKTIKEAFNRIIASTNRKIFWDLNPDNPNSFIYTEYIDNYKEKNESGELIGGYNYQHFTINDNITVTEERKREILTQYDVGSIWYKRDILGQRCVAEGLIYRLFADNREEFNIKEKISGLMEINIGVDFGGTGSGHSFVATGITRGCRDVIALSSERHFGEIDPDKLGLLFVEFCLKIVNVYGSITCVYCDSAEQVLIRGLRSTAKKNGLGWLKIVNAYKSAINDRINLVSRLMAQGRFKYTDDCKTLEIALCSAVWDSKEITKNVRLDDGSSDIDTLDAFEYSIEKHITKFIKYE
ncbi:PBSX family phage terminase large subunit (plasmid) [Clostridioides difficile]|uniref:PBSX family phage terminase large subunit n=1 Tax=Clostridioides difficile TaxID=1496 RepID=UPI0021C7F210|nr:PBSX family phage terminase large subunit [Clostridioides difficile]UWD43277.1 PBSX family phage terminase large subunit [Clostridioides difficile]UWD46823.1 PBSX family phage terminase large subunit [Clostridioides difficile]UWD50704.1 PBSX family phage terminase large subunit [Clostridioides phage Hain-Saunders-2022a]